MIKPMTDYNESMIDFDSSLASSGEVEAGGRRGAVTPDMVRTYLQEIGRVPLLTHEQEIILGKQVQQMMQLVELREKNRHRDRPTAR